jgi:hypothetical protein
MGVSHEASAWSLFFLVLNESSAFEEIVTVAIANTCLALTNSARHKCSHMWLNNGTECGNTVLGPSVVVLVFCGTEI